jgi:hypothetical protein
MLLDRVAARRLGLAHARVGRQFVDLVFVIAFGFQAGPGFGHHLMEAVIALGERSGAALDAELLRRHAHDAGASTAFWSCEW